MSLLVPLALASNNQHKVDELRDLLHGMPVQIFTRAEALGGYTLQVEEDGATLAANARKKGYALAAATGMLTLADDSGLEVDALDGRPGVYSSRFAHEHATDEENNQALLAALKTVAPAARSARFRCVLALFQPGRLDQPMIAEGTCEGSIATAPHGTCGFGYDPIFLLTGSEQKTMAELLPSEKNQLSHRANALRALVPTLREILASHFPTMAGTRA